MFESDEEEKKTDVRINVMDAFGGIGGNVIQFGRKGFSVGVEIDPVKTQFIKNNAKVYGLREHADFQVIERDFLQLESYEEASMMADAPEGNFLKFPVNNANK